MHVNLSGILYEIELIRRDTCEEATTILIFTFAPYICTISQYRYWARVIPVLYIRDIAGIYTGYWNIVRYSGIGRYRKSVLEAL